jgi:O-methyltransferase involved in polyketide biosynthesis
LSLVPVDFEKQSLIDSLRMSGYRIDASGIFSWLGVVQFLEADAIFSTLRTVAALAPGTEIIFEYLGAVAFPPAIIAESRINLDIDCHFAASFASTPPP